MTKINLTLQKRALTIVGMGSSGDRRHHRGTRKLTKAGITYDKHLEVAQ